MANELVKYEPGTDLVIQAERNVETIDDLDGLNQIQDKAMAIREAARQSKQPKIVWNYCMATAIMARWKIGKMLGPAIPHQGGRPTDNTATLAALTLDEHESRRWQLLARIARGKLKQHIQEYDTEKKTLTFAGCYKLLPRPAAPTGTYDVIVVDPPWEMKKIARTDVPNQEDMDYAATMKEQEIVDWGKEHLRPATNCHLFLWTTQRYLPAAIRIVGKWESKYVCIFVWHKPGGFQPFDLPQYNCEFVIYARIGSPKFSSTKGLKTCLAAPRGGHSAKPDAFYDMIRKSTTGKRIDMFARKARDGFEIWGDEV